MDSNTVANVDMANLDMGVLMPLMQAFLAQMDSAMKVSDLLAKHDNSEEITVDHLIGGLVYRLMVPMNKDETTESLDSAKEMIDKLDEPETESDEEYDPLDECYDKEIDFGSRKIKHPTCNCDICGRLRVCLLNYHCHECNDPLAQKFKDSIDTTCQTHKIFI